MREIKFRGKRVDNGQWIHSNCICCPNNEGVLSEAPMLKENGVWVEVVKATICEYVGLKDENGKDIYENDIIEFPSRYFYGNERERVYFLNGIFFCGYHLYEIHKKCEIVGNAYDNPELLEREG